MLRGTWLAICGGVVVASCLAGCTGGTAPSTNPGTPQVTVTTSRWGSKSATENEIASFYRSYVRVVDEVAADGGRDVVRLRPFLTAAAYKQEVAEADVIMNSKRRTSGTTRVSVVKVQQIDRESGTATTYICSDQSDVKVLDAEGKDVTPAQRESKSTLLVTFAKDASGIQLSRSQTWAGASVCR